jgi:GSH-dependent disulfide-bond oxidoreductase
MITLHYWPTPNGHKITMFLEETGLDYRIAPVDIGAGDQFKPEFLRIAPNNRMPAIVDNQPQDGGAPVSVFESGAILQYLAEKAGKFLPTDARGKADVMQWVFWQMAGLGPMTGQYGHFHVYAPEDVPYAKQRYKNEAHRLHKVLNTQLQDREFICSDYSIADMACYPWISPYAKAPLDMDNFPNVQRWRETIAARPATQRAYAVADTIQKPREMTDEMRKILFGINKD